MQEIWKDITGLEGYYQISSLGNIKSLRTGKSMKQQYDQKGYFRFSPSVKGKKYTLKVHRLVAQEFIDIPEELISECHKWQHGVIPVNHIDGNKSNNVVDNLEWCSPSQNTIHAKASGLKVYAQGENSPNAKMTHEDVRKIRELYVPRHPDFNCYALAKIFNTTPSLICNIVNYKTYKFV